MSRFVPLSVVRGGGVEWGGGEMQLDGRLEGWSKLHEVHFILFVGLSEYQISERVNEENYQTVGYWIQNSNYWTIGY